MGRDGAGSGPARRLAWRLLSDAFKVLPEPPTLPGAETTTRSFRPAAGFLGYLKFHFWVGVLLIDALVLALWIVAAVNVPLAGFILAPVALLVVVLPDVVAWVALHLRHDVTWYVLSDRSLGIRRGIWIVQETTITYENVQNVEVKQGPLQRYFGIANVIVETAGGGGSDGDGTGAHVGLIEGVADAQSIRDLVMARVRRSRRTGLGDEAGERRRDAEWNAAHVECLRAIRADIPSLGGAAGGPSC